MKKHNLKKKIYSKAFNHVMLHEEPIDNVQLGIDIFTSGAQFGANLMKKAISDWCKKQDDDMFDDFAKWIKKEFK